MAILSRRLWPLLLVIISLTVMACSPASSTVSSAMLDPAQVQLAMAETEVTVFRSPTCGCCGAWVDHMTEAGFVVRDEMTDDMDAVKQGAYLGVLVQAIQAGKPDFVVLPHTYQTVDFAPRLAQQTDAAYLPEV
ncbi:MAG: hypothetical protein AAFZ80_11170, partial [Cyanobacteria bacterium P01_A01_bin.105]